MRRMPLEITTVSNDRTGSKPSDLQPCLVVSFFLCRLLPRSLSTGSTPVRMIESAAECYFLAGGVLSLTADNWFPVCASRRRNTAGDSPSTGGREAGNAPATHDFGTECVWGRHCHEGRLLECYIPDRRVHRNEHLGGTAQRNYRSVVKAFFGAGQFIPCRQLNRNGLGCPPNQW